MIEELTENKLTEYEFDDNSIDRLLHWNNYECVVVNNRGYFWASNIEKKIYSGSDGEVQYLNRQKTKFKTFDDLFDEAIFMDSIMMPKTEPHRSLLKRKYNFEFNLWLQNVKGWVYGDSIQYIGFLSKENWKEFLQNEKEKSNSAKEKLDSEKKGWQLERVKTSDMRKKNKPPFYSFVLAGQLSESIYQLKFIASIKTNDGLIPVEPTEVELILAFIRNLYQTDVNEIDEYLDFHFNKYAGKKIDWWRYTKSRLEDMRIDSKTNTKILHPHDEFIFEWMDKKKSEIRKHSNKSDAINKKDQNQLINSNKMINPRMTDDVTGKEFKNCSELIDYAKNRIKHLKSLKPSYNELAFWELENKEIREAMSESIYRSDESALFHDELRNYLHYINNKLHKQSAHKKKTNISMKRKNRLPREILVKPLMLCNLFESISKYKFIMNLLVEQNYCEANTFIWKYGGKGNKGLLVDFIKDLHVKKYYRDNKRPTIKQIKEIAQNTFGLNISTDTIKRAKPGEIQFPFIPLAPTIE